MMGVRNKKILRSILSRLRDFVLFFVLIGFVVTSTFLVFFAAVSMPEEDIRTFAPLVFYNVIVLTVLFAVFDGLRRKITVDRPVREIQTVLRRLMQGDFSARITTRFVLDDGSHFREIAQSINLLAEELAGVETLRTDFIANVSHELKTPLAVMQNYGSLLQQPDLSEEQRMEYSRAITHTSRRLASLITNILKLNKLENQQIFPMISEYNLGEQLCECLLQFEEMWEQKELNIETGIEEDVIINSDAELLSLVWNNLISNAVKFSEKGGTITVGLRSEEDVITVKVSDTGCGISPEVGAHIFEKFYQGDTSHSTQGNGLGLALVKRVMDIMKGEISVESVQGQGSTFTVRIGRTYINGK